LGFSVRYKNIILPLYRIDRIISVHALLIKNLTPEYPNAISTAAPELTAVIGSFIKKLSYGKNALRLIIDETRLAAIILR
jgi:hypothetical protein